MNLQFLHNLSLGFGVAFQWLNLLYCLLGVLVGTLIGVLPGIGPIATIAMLLPFTSASPWRADHARRHLLRRAVRWLDDVDPGQHSGRGVLGRDLPRRLPDGVSGPGRAGARDRGDRLVLRRLRLDRGHGDVRPPLAEVALKFGPAEYFSLMVLGLVAAVVLAHGSVLKAIVDGGARPGAWPCRLRRELGRTALRVRH